MTNWNKLALAVLVVGFELDLFAIINPFFVFMGEKGAVEALMICGLLCYIVALVLLMLMVFGDLKGRKAAAIIKICFTFMACVFIVVGVAVYGARVNNTPNPYLITLATVSAAAALLSGIFCCVHLVKESSY